MGIGLQNAVGNCAFLFSSLVHAGLLCFLLKKASKGKKTKPNP